MGLSMKNFDIMGVQWKTRHLGGVHEKPIQGELPRIWDSLDSLPRTWIVCRFKGRGAWQKREWWQFSNETNIKLSKRNLSGKNKVSYFVFSKGKYFNKGYKLPHSCLPLCSLSILQHLIAFSDYPLLSLQQSFHFAFVF